MVRAKSFAVFAVLMASLWAPDSAISQTSKKPSNIERTRQFLGLAPPADPVAAGRGQKIFAQNCAFCHGPNATGGEGPDLLRSSVVLHDEKGETIGPVLLKGRPDKGMPSFAGFTDAQVYDVAEFLHQRVEQAANRAGYKTQNVVTGSVEGGRAYFNGAGRCNACHSATGDLAHIAARLEPPDLQAQFLYPSESLTPEERKASLRSKVTVSLPSGEQVSGTLKSLDDFDISIIDDSGAIKSWPRDEINTKIEDPLAAHRQLLARYSDADVHNILAYLVTLK